MLKTKRVSGPPRPPTLTKARKGQETLNDFTIVGDKLIYALIFFDQGVKEAPCKSDDKAYLSGYGPYKKHIETDEQLDHFLRETGLNYALLTGTGSRHKDYVLVVIDFDDEAIYQHWSNEVGQLAETFTVKSARGYHVYYWSKDARSWKGTGFEVMGLHKAIMGPFCTHPSGAIYTPQNRPWIRQIETLEDFPLLNDTRPELAAPPAIRPAHLGGGVVQQIKNIWSILAIIESRPELSGRVRLKSSDRGRGRWYAGFCPFHDDRRKSSLWVDAERNLFGCQACSARGDVINFLAKLEGWTLPEAIRQMAKGAA